MTSEAQQPVPAKKSSFWKITGLILLTVILSVVITFSLVVFVFTPDEFEPVTLDKKEEQVLDRKLNRLGSAIKPEQKNDQQRLTPEPYSEEGANRVVTLNERELNALLVNNTEKAQRLAIDLSDDLASLKVLVPLDPEFPLLGGRTLKITAGMEMRLAEGRPAMILKGVSLWGVPLPNAWLGNMKNIDLVEEFGDEKGFWKAFADGVEEIAVREGKLRIKLKE